MVRTAGLSAVLLPTIVFLCVGVHHNQPTSTIASRHTKHYYMMLRQIILAYVVASVGVQCDAFKQVKRISTLPIPSHRRGLRYYNPVSSSLFSIRGGSDSDGYDEDELGDDTYDFISSFESDLAEIRREAEIEAENEIQKLRGLIERRGKEQPSENDIDGSKEDDKLENEIVDDNNNEPTDDELLVQDAEEKLEALSDDEVTTGVIQAEVGNGEELPDDATDDIEQSETEIVGNDDGKEEETVSVEDDEDLQHDESEELPVEPNEISDDAAESDSETIDSDAAHVSSIDESTIDLDEAADDDDVIPEIKPKKASKKKKKSSKKGKKNKKKVKNRIKVPEESSELSDDGSQEIDIMGEESVMLTRTTHDDELTEVPLTGIWSYLRSDLGRALGLFIATMLLALITQRMQRQMEADGM